MVTRYRSIACALLMVAGLTSSSLAQSSTPEVEPTFVISSDAPTSTRTWASAEYLLWQVKSAPLPTPLITTGPADTLGPSERPGALGLDGTQVLLGGHDVNFGPSSGGRFTLGAWLGNQQTVGLEGSYLFLGQVFASHSVSAPGLVGTPPLALPFFNPTVGAQDSTGIALPRGNGFSGVADLTVSTRLQGAELNAVVPMTSTRGLTWELLGGFRFLDIDERLHFTTVSTNVPPQTADIFTTSDRFTTENDFYGGQIGVRARYRWNNIGLQAATKIALGSMHEVTHIRGNLLTNDFTNIGPVQAFPGGYLALPTNIGDYSRDQFAAVPEINLGVDYLMGDHVRLFAGYTFLYVSSVARPGDEIDSVINPTQGPGFTGVAPSPLMGAARPTFLGKDSSFFAQGINLGLEISY